MNRNPILEELYAAREKLLDDAGGDIHQYLEGVRQREAASGRLLPPTPQGDMGCLLAANNTVSGTESAMAAQ